MSNCVHALPSLQDAPSFLVGLLQKPVAVSQTPSTWHWSEAPQITGEAPVQVPAWQLSAWVHALPSLHVEPLDLFGLLQMPVPELHVPTSWHWSTALQTTGLAPTHLPAAQVSVWVHESPSVQAAPLLPATCLQPCVASHVSMVHGSLSSQSLLVVVPPQVPLAHLSLCVHATSSLQDAVLKLATQPSTLSQIWSVHGLPSLHVKLLPLHRPLAHWSALVQASLSVQLAPSLPAGVVQPVAGSQLSAVHGLPSLQTFVVPPQTLPVQVSETVQALPSLHDVLASASLC